MSEIFNTTNLDQALRRVVVFYGKKPRIRKDDFACGISYNVNSRDALIAGVAQLVEQLICNQQVVSSNLITSSI